MKGQILKIHSDFYYVKFADNAEVFECKIREVLKKQKQKVLVGDFVECTDINLNKKTAVIEKIFSRTNFLTRPSVANVEQVIIISSIKEPDLDFEQLNRYISLAKYHKIKTKLCFNKNDLSEDDSIIEKIFGIYEPLGFEIVFTSALEKLGIEDFTEILGSKMTVFCGNSGVGKSSLINSIAPNLNIKTKEVSEKTSRGTHTTRHCEIIEIKRGKKFIKIIDTPGFSNLKFDFLLPNQIDELFDEIKKHKSGCKFKDCLHIQEEDCNVLANLSEIDISRYRSYLSFVQEAKEFKEKIKRQGTKKETSQKQGLNKQVAKISTRKRQSARNTLRQNIYKDFESVE
ncbi:MAG: ribosome small subunit-dependent GTPase A [bacterium]